jgi:DNA repair/transcription protein MET18/MMS19
MTDIRLYLVELENNRKQEATLVATQTAKRLETKDLKLLQLIESLGEFLNNEAPLTRERGM